MTEIKAILEALLYVSGEDGVTLEQMMKVLDASEGAVIAALKEIKAELERDDRGLDLVEVGGAYQLITKPEVAEYIEKLVQTPKPSTLSQAALETLAVIAYKQPVSRAEIEEVRGVKSEKALQTLMSKGLIKEVGRAEGTGRAILYGLTDAFFSHFGLKSLDELPPMPTADEADVEEDADLFYEKFQQTVLDI